MKKLSEYKDEESLDLLADLLEPCTDLFSDEALVAVIRKETKLKAIKYAIKNHKKEVVEIMAILNGVPVEEFHYNLFTLPMMVLEVFNDRDLTDFLLQQAKMDSESRFGFATENTEEGGKSDTSSTT